MGNIRSFSSVSIRDYTDLGQIILYLTCNQPTTVLYNPNDNASYSPNWATSNLVLTPVIQYNGSLLALNASGLTITFDRKEGSDPATALTTGETVTGGVLTVAANKIADATDNILTYRCHVTYTDPQVGVPISAESSMTFTMISQATEVKTLYITGPNTFLYDTDRNLVGADHITITANTTHTSIQQWQYKKADGTFAAYPTTHNPSITGSTLEVYANEQNVWLDNRRLILRAVSTAQDVYDIHEITKIYDGSAGNATLTAQLSNSTHYVPCDASGNVTSWNGSATTVYIYEGGQEVTNSWSIQTNLGAGLTGTYNSSTHTFTPSGLTNDTSYCDFVCTKQDFSTLTVRYTITKSKMGADGKDAEVYTLETDALAINKNEAGVFTPTGVTFTSYKHTGDTKTVYDGRFVIEETTNGSTFSTVYTSSTDEHSKLWSPSSANVTMIRATMCASGGTTTTLDTQSVVVTSDGATGNPGQNGVNGVSMGLGNYQDVLPCTSGGYTSSTKDISIPFYGYSGIQRIPTTATVGTLPTGITVKSNTPADATKDGLLVLTVANNSPLGNASRLTGDITITLACTYNTQTQSIDQKYTWTKNLKATDGNDAVILQIYSEDGGIIRNSSGSTTLKIRLIAGANEVTPATVQWAKYQSGGYTDISGETGTSLVVTDQMVDDMAFFRATVSYNGKSGYTAFYTVDDVQDPINSYLFATVSEFKNSQGFGAIYCRVYRNGEELDPIKSTTFSNTPPSAPSAGDFYYHLDPTNKTCVLKKYSGSAWANATETDTLTYSYYRNDSEGNAIDTNAPYKTQRCIYVDPSIINGRMMFICEVTD